MHTTDKQRVNRFLAAIKELGWSVRKAGDVALVSGTTVHSWQNKKIPDRLGPETRDAIDAFLEAFPHMERGAGAVNRAAALLAAERLEQLAADLRREAGG